MEKDVISHLQTRLTMEFLIHLDQFESNLDFISCLMECKDVKSRLNLITLPNAPKSLSSLIPSYLKELFCNLLEEKQQLPYCVQDFQKEYEKLFDISKATKTRVELNFTCSNDAIESFKSFMSCLRERLDCTIRQDDLIAFSKHVKICLLSLPWMSDRIDEFLSLPPSTNRLISLFSLLSDEATAYFSHQYLITLYPQQSTFLLNHSLLFQRNIELFNYLYFLEASCHQSRLHLSCLY